MMYIDSIHYQYRWGLLIPLRSRGRDLGKTPESGFQTPHDRCPYNGTSLSRVRYRIPAATTDRIRYPGGFTPTLRAVGAARSAVRSGPISRWPGPTGGTGLDLLGSDVGSTLARTSRYCPVPIQNVVT